MPNPTSKENTLPPPIQDLNPREIFLFTGIPLHLIDGFINGRFKPCQSDREKLTKLGNRLYRWIEIGMKRDFIDREKYRRVKPFLSLAEKEDLFDKPGKDGYREKLDGYIQKYWDRIVIAIAGE
jgi:hypothetical protein